MSNLRRLEINGSPKLRFIPFFSKLEQLAFRNIVEWKGWSVVEEKKMQDLKAMNIF